MKPSLDKFIKGIKDDDAFEYYIMGTRCFCLAFDHHKNAYISISGVGDEIKKSEANSLDTLYNVFSKYLEKKNNRVYQARINPNIPYYDGNKIILKSILETKTKGNLNKGDFSCIERKIASLATPVNKPTLTIYRNFLNSMEIYCKYTPCNKCLPFVEKNDIDFHYIIEYKNKNKFYNSNFNWKSKKL